MKIFKKIDKNNLLIFLSVLSAGTLLIANFSAAKLWSFFGVAVDGGLIIFPLSYVLGDLVMEFYGRKTARTITFASFLINLIATITLMLVSILPPHAEWGGQLAFTSIFTAVPRIVLASLSAYIVSQLANIYFFEKIKAKTGGKYLLARTIGSSFVARFLDILIFDIIAFFGVIPFTDFVGQVIFAYFSGMLLEIILSPFTILSVKFFRPRLK